jgi:hypothetical protein
MEMVLQNLAGAKEKGGSWCKMPPLPPAFAFTNPPTPSLFQSTHTIRTAKQWAINQSHTLNDMFARVG